MKVIAFPGQKGGSGKSTLCINLGVELAQQGLRVLVLDADPQESARSWYQAAQSYEDAHPDYLYPTVVGAAENLKKTLQTMSTTFDVVLIDLPGRDAQVQRQALLQADLALVVVAPGTFDVWSLQKTIEYIEEARELRRELDELSATPRPLEVAFVRNRVGKNQTLSRQVAKLLESGLFETLKTVVHHRVAYGEAPSMGLGVTLYSNERAAREIKQLTNEVKQRYLQLT